MANSLQRTNMKHIMLYTDGSCLGNPGPGGIGVVMEYKGKTKELHGYIPDTTNNRAEMVAVIEGLKALKKPCHVTVITDSQYIVNTMTKGWRKAKNQDLWIILATVSALHEIEWQWVRAHDEEEGDPRNERANEIAQTAASTGALRAFTEQHTYGRRVQ